jgi:pimeloyl-ACP methyl ester carboxylesterase/plasmid stabilization system protein ParE
MDTVPETRYVESGDCYIAYQVVGEGPVDIVFFGPLVGHVELIWDDPGAARFLRRLASAGRLILFDKRGTGMSDPVPVRDLATLEQRQDDVLAVMDAAGSERAFLVGSSEGGQLAVMVAASHPERALGLVLHASYARVAHADDYPFGFPPEMSDALISGLGEHWGSTGLVHLVIPSIADDPRRVDWVRHFVRRSASPGAARAQFLMNIESDIRSLLPTIQAPTLVLHAGDDRWIPVDHSRYLADHIPGARLVELPGADHLPFGDHADLLADEILEFATGTREAAAPERVLATVLFSDIVGSTTLAADLGDSGWRQLLELHDRAVRRQIDRHRGRAVKATGDGFLAVFDGPARAIRCAEAIRDATRALGVGVRIGLHTGEVEVREDDDLAGLAVHIAQRVSSLAGSGEIVVSGVVPLLVSGSGLRFDDRGTHELKGVPDAWQVLAVAS